MSEKEEKSEPIEVRGAVFVSTKTVLVCPQCDVRVELDGDFDSCLIECLGCGAELRVKTE